MSSLLKGGWKGGGGGEWENAQKSLSDMLKEEKKNLLPSTPVIIAPDKPVIRG